MSIEVLEIIITAKIEDALREVMKLVPAIKETVKQAKEAFEKVDTKAMQGKFQQAVQFMKKKIQDLKKSTQNSEIAIKVNNKDAQKQISQVQKQIDSLQEKINARQMKLNTITPKLDEITSKATKAVTPDGVSPNNPAIQKTIDNSLSQNKEYSSLLAQEEKITQELALYNKQLNDAKNKMSQLKQETNQTATIQSKLGSFFSNFKSKLEQAKGSIGGLKSAFNQMPKLTQNITNNIKNMGKGLKQGLGHILKYAGALFSLRGVYSVLNSSAQSWLSSQNAGAKQLSANIDYMKYAMGSALAPVIQFVTNLVYQLMKAIQMVAYALTGVNIFAKASAKSYGAMAGSAKKAKEETKQLAGIHDEINNIQNNDSSDSGGGSGGGATPSFDLSQMENTPNSIIDAIKNGNWYEVGSIIGQKLNETMASIPWDKIQNGAKNIATKIGEFINGFVDGLDWSLLGSTIGNGINTAFIFANTLLTTINWGNIGKSIAKFLNSAILTTDWNLIGTTFANGLNAVIHFGYNFVTTFDWKQFGKSIGNSINSFFSNIDWATAGKMFGDGIKGVLNTITTILTTINWSDIGENIVTFITNIDWNGAISSLCSALGAAIGGASALIASILLEGIIYPLADFFLEKTEECGGNVILGILKGIVDGLIGIGEWIYNNLVYPLIKAFCDALGIHSPSTVFAEFGQNIIQGLFNGIQSLVGIIAEIWQNIKTTAVQIFNKIKESIITIWNNIKTSASNIWDNIKNIATSVFNGIKDTISNVFNALKDTITNIWNGIVDTISNVWNTIVTKVKEGVSGAWNAITSVCGNIAGWFKDKFSNAWQAVKNVFSTGGAIFDGIKDGILNGLKTIVNAIIGGINKVIAVPFNGLNSALKSIRSVNIMGLQPFSWIKTISVPQIPKLAKGGVLYDETLVMAGEYSGARNNPEIVTPQNIMEETFDKVMSKYQENNDGQPIHLTVNVGNKKLGQILLDNLRDMKRQTGSDLEALVGG